jgi:FkbM family methyltransferase
MLYIRNITRSKLPQTSIIFTNNFNDLIKINIALLIYYTYLCLVIILRIFSKNIMWKFLNKLPLSLSFVLRLVKIKLIAITFIDWFRLNFIFRTYTLDEYVIFLDWERHTMQYISELRNGDTVIDVGAHIGSYTIRCAKLVGENGKVIAVEPIPENLILLKNNTEFNKLNNVLIEDKAIYNKQSKIKLFYYDAHPAGASVFKKFESDHLHTIIVETTTLDAIIEKYNLKRIDLLKVDVEGAEAEVLSDKALSITRKIIIEVWPSNLSKIFEMLKSHGFKIINLGLHHGGLNYYLYSYK